jgi:hypothetical protein
MFYFIFILFTALMMLAMNVGNLMIGIPLVLAGFLIILPLVEELEDENR